MRLRVAEENGAILLDKIRHCPNAFRFERFPLLGREFQICDPNVRRLIKVGGLLNRGATQRGLPSLGWPGPGWLGQFRMRLGLMPCRPYQKPGQRMAVACECIDIPGCRHQGRKE